ncbi:hypothetical protein RMR10_024160 (plasmid) [Agrobacterium rosae]|uniref:hypothetical protein n=1 Tax=Agrobacterium rosae TaxID=1972867 RepID=UPI00097D4CCF|nr:hypothetical protein [Agrobacterium rosae]MDX8317286.1 hypothetical protein [Agrobacterium rosae]
MDFAAAGTDVCKDLTLRRYVINFAHFIRAARFDEPVVSMNCRYVWHVDHRDHNLTVQIVADADLSKL